jgi:hypothetical protein
VLLKRALLKSSKTMGSDWVRTNRAFFFKYLSIYYFPEAEKIPSKSTMDPGEVVIWQVYRIQYITSIYFEDIQLLSVQQPRSEAFEPISMLP